MSRFSACHPAVTTVYFASVFAITMFSAHPILHALSLLGAVLFSAKSDRIRLKDVCFYLVLFLVISVSNPLFVHSGETPLFFLNGNAVTAEAVMYGVHLGIMLLAVMWQFRCFNLVMTSDKLLFMFGKISPKVALLISSALRSVPLLKVKAESIRRTQSAQGLFNSDAWTDKLRANLQVYSALITWALENAIDIGASMKGRGYGLKGRSSFSLFHFRRTDLVFLILIIILDLTTVLPMIFGALDFAFYPTIKYSPPSSPGNTALLSFGLLTLFPFILEVKEDLQWKYYRSRI